jgi:hypothetical protein
MQREAAFHKTEALFCALLLPALAIASPGKNIVGDSTERNYALWVSEENLRFWRNRSHPQAFQAAGFAGIMGSVRLARAAAMRLQA